MEITGDWQPRSVVDNTVRNASSPTSLDQPAFIPTFGHYQLLSELGRGGMGIVYKARQTGLDRIVALKIIRGVADDDRAKIRFAAEAKALAKISHPHIVGVYDVGEEAGFPYFSMEYVDGDTLAQRLKDGPTFSESDAAKLIEELAGAVQSAHSVGVLHRDIKPGNVLIGSTGIAKLTDYGLAKNLNEDQSVTVAGAALGTPAYMPPEQAEGRLEDLGPATDVYSLGATLYELLTGRPPFRGETPGATVAKVLTQEVEPPSQYRKGLSRELEAIVLKCLEKNPARRYVSAAGLADDLTRWRSGLSTVARPLSRIKRSLRAIKRRPMAIVGTFAVVSVLAVFAATRERDPEKVAQALLQRGQKVTLIGPTGPPIKLNYLNGAVPVHQPDSKLPFSMSAPDQNLYMDLLSDPGIDRYRFTIDMRQVGTGRHPVIGYYFCRHNIGPEEKPSSLMISVTHHDIDTIDEIKTPEQKANAQYGKSIYTAAAELIHLPLSSNSHYLGRFGKANLNDTEKWRTMGVEVTPERITLLFSDEAGQLIPKKTIENHSEQIRNLNISMSTAMEQYYPQMNVKAEHYHIRGGIGLYVSQAIAEFRNAFIEPLPPRPPDRR